MEPSELSAENLVEETSCDANPIWMMRDTDYLVFRGADGHLLGPVMFRGVRKPALGYRFEVLAPGGPQTWLAAVRKAVAADQRPKR